ncbi:MAG: T9SS type A sorting domain-containing protein [Ignavibacteria bacterium]
MKQIIFIFLFQILLQNQIYCQWISQPISPGEGNLLTVDFADVNKGAIAGWKFGDKTLQGTGFYTTNAGKTWIRSTMPDSIRAILEIEFVNETTGFAVGAYNLPSTTSEEFLLQTGDLSLDNFYNSIGIRGIADYKGVLLKTTDAGGSWFIYGTVPEDYTYILGIELEDPKTIYITGDKQNGINFFPLISRSTDAGMSWINLSLPLNLGDLPDIVLNGNSFYASGYERSISSDFTYTGVILQTTNAGSSWSEKTFSSINNFTGIKFSNINTGYASGINNLLTTVPSSSLYKTTDAGDSWVKEKLDLDSIIINGIGVSKGTGKVVFFGNRLEDGGDLFYPREAIMGSSTQFGNKWNFQIVLDSGLLQSCLFLDPLNAYCVGSESNKSTIDPIVLHTSNGGVSINYSGHTIPSGFTLYQNYPNPFNPNTVITYELSKASNVKMSLFDTNGRLLMILVDRRQEPGYYSVKLDTGILSSGVFFYTMESDNFADTKKMLVIK